MNAPETRDPGQLLAAGETSLPCGFPLQAGKDGFASRLRHYRTCQDTYCQDRAAWARHIAAKIVDDLRRQAKRTS